jgi:hypothetical protein
VITRLGAALIAGLATATGDTRLTPDDVVRIFDTPRGQRDALGLAVTELAESQGISPDGFTADHPDPTTAGAR